jgi:MFS superfamily sulfate permease-like transporter
VRVRGAAVFLNLLGLERAIAAARDAEVRRVRLDVREARVVDHTVLHRMEQVAAEWPDCELEVVGLDALRSVGTAPHSCRVHA